MIYIGSLVGVGNNVGMGDKIRDLFLWLGMLANYGGELCRLTSWLVNTIEVRIFEI